MKKSTLLLICCAVMMTNVSAFFEGTIKLAFAVASVCFSAAALITALKKEDKHV